MRVVFCFCIALAASFGFAQSIEPIEVKDFLYGGDKFEESSVVDEAQELIDLDTYNNARKTAWCMSDSLWQQKREQFGVQDMPACPTEGICDDPIERDGTSTATKTINIYVHLMRNSNGSGGVNINNARAAYRQMLNDYAPYGIRFNLVGARWINNSTYATIPAYSPFSSAWFNAIANMKNQYAVNAGNVCNIFVSGQQSSFFGTLLGIATFPWDPDALTKQGGLWLNNIAMTGSSHTFAHELGHCFGLWHTHHGVSEVPSCSSCYELASGVDGDITGDFCSDTPPTPTNYNCSGPGGSDCQGTPWGPTQPSNIMGYGPDSCQNQFTLHQTKRMHCWIPDALPNWIQ